MVQSLRTLEVAAGLALLVSKGKLNELLKPLKLPPKPVQSVHEVKGLGQVLG